MEKIGVNFYDIFCDNLRKYSVADIVFPHIGDSTLAANLFEMASLDFVYIDACHDYRKVKNDICAWLPRVRSGGIIAGHDYDRHHGGVMKAVDEIFPKELLRFVDNSWIVDITARLSR